MKRFAIILFVLLVANVASAQLPLQDAAKRLPQSTMSTALEGYTLTYDADGNPVLESGAGKATLAGDDDHWDGVFRSLLNGPWGTVHCILVNGSDVYIGGDFLQVGSVTPARGVAKYNMTTKEWSTFGEGLKKSGGFASVKAIAISGTKLYVGGDFETAGTGPAKNVAMWDGASWNDLAGGVSIEGGNARVYSLAVDGDDVYVGGTFTKAGAALSTTGIARYNGGKWYEMSGGISTSVLTMAWLSNKQLVVGGNFDMVGGSPLKNLAKWDGTTWRAISNVDRIVRCLAVDKDDNVYVGGDFRKVGLVNASRIARWSESLRKWDTLGVGLNNSPYGIAIGGDSIYVGGFFTTAGGQAANHIARWNVKTSGWETLGSGVDSNVRAVTSLADGAEIFVGGDFSNVGGDLATGKSSSYFSRWVRDVSASIVDLDFASNGELLNPGIADANIEFHKNFVLKKTLTSDANGNFDLRSLEDDTYDLTITKPGTFKENGQDIQYTVKFKVPGFNTQNKSQRIIFPYTQVLQKKENIGSLQNLSMPGELLFGLTIPVPLVKSYNDSNADRLLDDQDLWAMRDSAEGISVSLARLLMAEKAVLAIEGNALNATTEMVKGILDLVSTTTGALEHFNEVGKMSRLASRSLKSHADLEKAAMKKGIEALLSGMESALDLMNSCLPADTWMSSAGGPVKEIAAFLGRIVSSRLDSGAKKTFLTSYADDLVKNVLTVGGVEVLMFPYVTSTTPYLFESIRQGREMVNTNLKDLTLTYQKTLSTDTAGGNMSVVNKSTITTNDKVLLSSRLRAGAAIGTKIAELTTLVGIIPGLNWMLGVGKVIQGVSIAGIGTAVVASGWKLSETPNEVRNATATAFNSSHVPSIASRKDNSLRIPLKGGATRTLQVNDQLAAYAAKLAEVRAMVSTDQKSQAVDRATELMAIDDSLTVALRLATLPLMNKASDAVRYVSGATERFDTLANRLYQSANARALFDVFLAVYTADTIDAKAELLEFIDYVGTTLAPVQTAFDNLQDLPDSIKTPGFIAVTYHDAPAEVMPGTPFEVRVTVSNVGSTAVDSTTLRLVADANTTGSDVTELGTLAPGDSRSFSWTLTNNAERADIGAYQIRIDAPGAKTLSSNYQYLITQDEVVSVKGSRAMNQISVRPNPSKSGDLITFAASTVGAIAKAEVVSITGDVVRLLDLTGLTLQWNGQTTGGDLATAGTYFLRVTGKDGNVETAKFVIE